MSNAAQQYLNAMYESSPRIYDVERALAGEMDFETWRAGLSEAFRNSLGAWPESGALNVKEVERVVKDGYQRVKLTYEGEDNLVTPTYLLIPAGQVGKGPAVVACTGHGFGVRDIVGIRADGSDYPEGESSYQKSFALELVKRGFTVIAPEPLGFGELMLEGAEEKARGSSCQRISASLLLHGKTLAGVRVRQFMRAVSLLETLDGVDAGRIGAMGISGGGTVASFLTILDARIRAAVVSGYACMYLSSIYAMYHCIDNYPVGLLNFAENDDLMSLVAPRPMLWESGSKDPIFPREGVERAADTVARVYRALGRGECFQVDRFEGSHEISGRMAYDFLRDALK